MNAQKMRALVSDTSLMKGDLETIGLMADILIITIYK